MGDRPPQSGAFRGLAGQLGGLARVVVAGNITPSQIRRAVATEELEAVLKVLVGPGDGYRIAQQWIRFRHVRRYSEAD